MYGSSITRRASPTPPQEQYEAVRDADAANDVTWLEPAPFNNTYAIATTNETAEEQGISSISDIREMIGG